MRKPRLLNLRGIRARTTIIAVLVVGVAAAIALAALVITARSALTGQITSNAEARAQDIGLLAKAGSVPDPIPGKGEALLVQVVDSGGKVTASSASINGQAALVDLTLAPGQSRTCKVPALAESAGGESAGEGGADAGTSFLITGVGVSSPAGPVTVIVAASLDPVQQLVDVLVPRLSYGLPAILLVVGVTVWLLTGRALRPVEAIRIQAEAISATSLERRLPLSGTSDEIERLALTMNRMLDRLELSSLAQRQFVSDASHELKSPIASMRTMLDVARKERPEDFDVFLDDLVAEDSRLEHLVRDLLTLARFDEGTRSTNVVEVDLDDVLLQATSAAARSGVVACDLSGVHPVRITASPDDVNSLIRNLLENAVRHAAACVWVTADVTDGLVVVTVSDDGNGIAPSERERVFDRFVRLDDSRARSEGGTGLGLAVCRAIARSMGGDVIVGEPTHGGATFVLHLPSEPLR
ncbi:MAG: HAMP domain-containing histidine kinase [Actinomycetia bacterium]|nr:HAMP domain-containing histidine kinase [Actinomycetes bacterium]